MRARPKSTSTSPRTSTRRSTSGPRRASGAGAIHPGYGFLAENADFAAAVEAAGLTWVGPPSESLRLGGDKLAAKRIARDAGVPVLPDGAPEEIGFPLLVKAAAGGGGRGMRVVRSAAELEDALAGRRAGGRGCVRRRHALLRALPRATAPRRGAAARRRARRGRRRRRARLLGSAPPPEGPRGGACARPLPRAADGAARRGGGVRPGGRLPQRRHRRVRARRRRVLLPRAERPHPGRAPRHRGRHGPRPDRRPDSHRRRRGACRRRSQAGGARGRGPAVRRGSEDVPPAGRTHRAARISEYQRSRSGSASTPASRKATRSGSPTTRWSRSSSRTGRRARTRSTPSRRLSPRPRRAASRRTCHSCAGSSPIPSCGRPRRRPLS